MPAPPPPEELAAELRARVDAACAEAAAKIAQADVFLLCTGAGFSADSGLAVYADVARVRAYVQRDFAYHDICQPKWLEDDPELFWGFWGQCFNDYRDTAPHAGYEILSRWAKRFHDTDFAQLLKKQLDPAWPFHFKSDEPPYNVPDRPGAFFAFTSNVDGHHLDWFAPHEVRECHGNVELYQCASRRAGCRKLWRAPLNFRFSVDTSTMRALEMVPSKEGSQQPRSESACSTTCSSRCSPCGGSDLVLEEEDEPEELASPTIAEPRVGRVRGGGRPGALRQLTGPVPDAVAAGFARNRPVCLSCNGPARPAILMFGDFDWQDSPASSKRWKAWSKTVEQIMLETSRKENRKVKAVILEIGAGRNVPTIRSLCERMLHNWKEAGADATLVRVNPELPLGDTHACRPGGHLERSIVSIMARGLDSLCRMDSMMPQAIAAAATFREANVELDAAEPQVMPEADVEAKSRVVAESDATPRPEAMAEPVVLAELEAVARLEATAEPKAAGVLEVELSEAAPKPQEVELDAVAAVDAVAAQAMEGVLVVDATGTTGVDVPNASEKATMTPALASDVIFPVTVSEPLLPMTAVPAEKPLTPSLPPTLEPLLAT